MTNVGCDQIAAVFEQLEVEWPLALRRTFRVFSALNLNIDLIASECAAGGRVDYTTKWIFSVTAPLLICIVVVLVYAVVRLMHRLFPGRIPLVQVMHHASHAVCM